MTTPTHTRRAFLAATGASVVGVAGCLTDDTSDEADPDADGFGPELSDPPEPIDADVSSFETYEQDGIDVPLAPIEVTYNWYRRQEARFVDARGGGQYEDLRIQGAAFSPAPEGPDGEDAVTSWPTDATIVTYCGCPHTLASARAATLIQNGYENVYAIDEGFDPWVENGYPVAGNDAEDASIPPVWTITGQTDPSFADELVWAVHEPSDQREAKPIGADGSFQLDIKFSDVTADTVLTLRTPAEEIEAPLGQLVDSPLQLQ